MPSLTKIGGLPHKLDTYRISTRDSNRIRIGYPFLMVEWGQNFLILFSDFEYLSSYHSNLNNQYSRISSWVGLANFCFYLFIKMNELSVHNADWTRVVHGSEGPVGRVGSSHDFAGFWRVGSGRVSTSDLLVFYWLFLGTWIDMNLRILHSDWLIFIDI